MHVLFTTKLFIMEEKIVQLIFSAFDEFISNRNVDLSSAELGMLQWKVQKVSKTKIKRLIYKFIEENAFFKNTLRDYFMHLDIKNFDLYFSKAKGWRVSLINFVNKT